MAIDVFFSIVGRDHRIIETQKHPDIDPLGDSQILTHGLGHVKFLLQDDYRMT